MFWWSSNSIIFSFLFSFKLTCDKLYPVFKISFLHVYLYTNTQESFLFCEKKTIHFVCFLCLAVYLKVWLAQFVIWLTVPNTQIVSILHGNLLTAVRLTNMYCQTSFWASLMFDWQIKYYYWQILVARINCVTKTDWHRHTVADETFTDKFCQPGLMFVRQTTVVHEVWISAVQQN